LFSGVIVLSGVRRVVSRLLRATLIFGFCVILESLQMINSHNRFEWHDLKVDALAIAAAWAALILVQITLGGEDPKQLHPSPSSPTHIRDEPPI
jgi:hypothetical protein